MLSLTPLQTSSDGTPGDEVTVEIENVFPNYAFASIVEEPASSSETTN